MTNKKSLYAATDENLVEHALEPSMRWLVAAALDGTTITYGDIKHRLESEEGFSTIFATRIGMVAGSLMEKIQAIEPNAPLINVLVVNQIDRLPSKGAGSFMAVRFGNPRLGQKNYKERHPASWKSFFDRAASEVYAYSPEQWSDLYHRVFDANLSGKTIDAERDKRQEGNENDFGAGSGKYGAGGEGKFHKSLRLWVEANPSAISRSYAKARADTEFGLDSGDRVDVVYHLAKKTVVLEVKSRISNLTDLRRGVYQCIKYRAVKKAMDVRDNVIVEAVLVTEIKLPGEISELLKQHGIRHYLAPIDRA